MSGARSQAIWVTAAAAGLEIVTGAGLVVAPSLLARLLFGSEVNASGDLVGRISVYLIYVGMGRVNVGVLLWPAAAAHLILAILLASVWMGRRASG
jgi:hypothetical protein